MDKFLKRNKLPKVTQEDKYNLRSPISITKKQSFFFPCNLNYYFFKTSNGFIYLFIYLRNNLGDLEV